MRRMVAVSFVYMMLFAPVARCESDDLDTQLMLNTFKISNPKSSATVWFVARPGPDSKLILVTAHHVFSKMEGDEATLNLRKKDDKDPDIWVKVPIKIKVRNEGKALWTKHPDADVAAMLYTPPADFKISGVSADLLATDDVLKKYEIHPGDVLKCTGFPHPVQFNSGAAWFPVVRLGCFAGFPLTPMSKYKTFLADINTFEGNSGGALYFTDNNRYFAGKTQPGRIQFLVGLLSEQHFINDKFDTPYESGTFKHRLELGVIVNAGMIRETIDLLLKPAAPNEKPTSAKNESKENGAVKAE